jgi:hypothetical protein
VRLKRKRESRPAFLGEVVNVNQIKEKVMKIIQLNALPTDEADKYVEQVGKLFHAEWKDCEPDYATEDSAIIAVARRVAVEPLFVAIDKDGELAGVASIGSDDYYDGFCDENRIASPYIGRDLVVVERFRRQEFAGLRVWEHLLRERLHWVRRHGGYSFVVFAEKRGPSDLVSLFARHGARYVRDLVHRDLPAGSIAMLEYNVRSALASLEIRLLNCC